MSILRKDYVLDKFVVLPIADIKHDGDGMNKDQCPYCPGNESMTEPALIALVAKDGMLQRLSDSDESFVDGWCVRVFQSEQSCGIYPIYI